MPAAAAAAVAAAVSAAGYGTVIAAIAYAATYVAVSAVITFGVNLVLGALAKPKAPAIGGGSGSFSQTAANRSINIKQPVEPWNVTYGSIRKAGVFTFIGVSGSDNEFLHLVVTLAGHRVARIGEMYFGGEHVPLDSNGEATGEFAGLVLVEKNVGTPDQEAFPQLVSDTASVEEGGDRWTADNRQSGRAGVHIRLEYDEDRFANGVPDIAFDIDGRLVFDPRETQIDIVDSTPGDQGFAVVNTSTAHNLEQGDSVFVQGHTGSQLNLNGERYVSEVISSTSLRLFIGQTNSLGSGGVGGTVTKMVYTDNTDLCIADYVMNRDFGLNFDYSTEIDSASLLTAINVDDELVDLRPENNPEQGVTFDDTNNIITLDEDFLPLITGNVVTFSPGEASTLPTEIVAGTEYFWVRTEPAKGFLATTLRNARKRVVHEFSAASGSNFTMNRIKEARYTSNGVFKTDQTPENIIQEMLTANAGKVTLIGGLWRFLPAFYRPPTVDLDIDDLRGQGFKVVTRLNGRTAFNAIKGVYASPENLWQPADFPAVTNDLYLEQDGGERTFKDVDYPWTTSTSSAQRIAKIDLEKVRQEINLPNVPFKMTAYKLQAGDTVTFTSDILGWNQKIFEVISSDLIVEESENEAGFGEPILGVALSLQETAAEVYDWNSGEETLFDPAPDSGLPDPFDARAPGQITITESLFTTIQGGGVKVRVNFAWEAAPDRFASVYEPEYKLTSAPVEEFISLGQTRSLFVNIDDVAPGVYDFRVRSVSAIGVRSEYTTLTQEILGLTARPSAPTGLTLQTAGGIAVLRWDMSLDLDVIVGGTVDFRHAPTQTGATLATSQSIGNPVAGSDQLGLVPLREGTYLVRFVDSSGFASEPTLVSTDGAQALEFSPVANVVEHPAFSGAKSSIVKIGNTITMGGASPIDAWPEIDTIADFDFFGGVVSSGTYDFATGINLGAANTLVRLRPTIVSQVINQANLIDSRTENIDLWDNFDGVAGAEADVQVWFRTTNDDPTSSPTYGPYQKLDSSEVSAWGIQFQARFSNIDTSYNIIVSELSVRAEEIV